VISGFPVPPEGPLHAKIAFVGEAPGAQEEAQGRPFVGLSGMLLDSMLIEVGIPRRECYITNVSKIRPLRNNFKLFYFKGEPTPELRQSIKDLHAELLRVRPNIIVALGGEALKALTGKTSIEHWRGSLLRGPGGIKVLATYHPAYVSRVYEARPIVDLDLRRARKESLFPEIKIPPHVFVVEPSFKQVMEFLKRRPKRLAFDIETLGTPMHIRCLGFADNSNFAICIPFMRLRYQYKLKPGGLTPGMSVDHYWCEEEEREILRACSDLLGDSKVEKIAQNFPFDARYLEGEFGIRVENLWMDTMVAHHVCYSELPKSLDFLASIYTRIPYYSDYERAGDLSTWTYNCYDCIATFKVAEKLEKEMEELGVSDFYRDLAQPAMIALARAGNRGILVDQVERKKLDQETEIELEEVKKSLAQVAGFEVNPNSPKQVKELLYTVMKLAPQFHRKTRKETTDEAAIDKLQAKYPEHQKLFNLLIKYRELTKLLGTFLRSSLNVQGRMETSYNATGTVTGRISSSTTIEGLGGNMQQVPRGDFRRIYIAPPGKVLIKVDLSQAEIRAVAWFARIKSLIEKFQDPNFDVHKWNATLVYGVPLEEVTSNQRQQAKHCLHSANYRGSPRTAVKHAKVAYQVAKVALERYKAALPELPLWWIEIEDEVRSVGRLRTPLGRLRIFFGRRDESLFRSATAQLPQSTVGDIINRGFFLLDERLPEGCFPLLQVHDEIIVEALEDKVDECVKLIRECLEIPIEFPNLPPLLIPADISKGPNWWNQEKIK